MTTSGAHPLEPKVCTDCGRPMWQKHAETCTGPPRVVAPEPECACGHGMFHDPLCELVTGRRPAGVTGKETG